MRLPSLSTTVSLEPLRMHGTYHSGLRHHNVTLRNITDACRYNLEDGFVVPNSLYGSGNSLNAPTHIPLDHHPQLLWSRSDRISTLSFCLSFSLPNLTIPPPLRVDHLYIN